MPGIQDISELVHGHCESVIERLREIPVFEQLWQVVLRARLVAIKIKSKIKGENDPLTLAKKIYFNADYELMILQLHPIIEVTPNNPDAWSLLGLANHKLGFQESAIIAFKEALKYEPDNCTTLYNLGRQYVLLNEPDIALGYIETIELILAERKQVEDVDLIYLKATVYELQHNNAGAIEAYKKVIELENEHPARCFLAELYAGMNDMKLAMGLLDEHLAIYPTDVDALNLKCVFYGKLEQWDEVIRLAENMIESNPHRSEFYNHLSLAYYTKDNFDKSIEYCQQALNIDSEYALALSNLGYTYIRTERWDEAKETFERYLKIATDEDPNYQGIQQELELLEVKATGPEALDTEKTAEENPASEVS